MIELYVVLVIVWAHWFADFILQSDYHAVNKSKDNFVLFQHICWYSIPMTLIGLIIPINLLWVIVNAILHAMTDYVTSRMTSKLWQQEKRHWFFVTIGADQAIHMTCLFLTYQWLCGGL
jgi:membrane-bound metal-dependent hydrolase YbcI (DUF457 family)